MAPIADNKIRAQQGTVPREPAHAQPESIGGSPESFATRPFPGPALRALPILPKLSVGQVNDPAEAAADRVAGYVVAALHGPAVPNLARPPARLATSDPVMPEVGAAGGAVSDDLQGAIAAARGGGSALPSPVRRDMESVLGTDLSAVRVHSGPAVAGLATRMSAQAFTIGSEMFFPHGLPDTGSPAGTKLLAHELAHTVANAPAARRTLGLTGLACPIGSAVVRRTPESEQALNDLAMPKIMKGPEIAVQTKVVDLIEETIPRMAQDRNAAEEKLNQERRKFTAKNSSPEELQQLDNKYSADFGALKKNYPLMDITEIYLGSIVLNGIPPEGKEADLYELPITETDFALKSASHGLELVRQSKTEKLIVRNTMGTMQAAGQLDYLRKAGFVGDGWQIVVEIHYIRNRPPDQVGFHKDTLGQTLFVNLNYTNKKKITGPEYVVNPPLQQEHEKHIESSLPKRFMADIKHVRAVRGTAKTIGTGTVQPHGVVSFVDEAIHHSTPLVGHRQVSAQDVRLFLQNETPYQSHYPEALAAWNTAKDSSKRPSPDSFAKFFAANVSADVKARWAYLLQLTDGGPQSMLERPALQKKGGGLSEEDVDKLLSQYGPAAFNTVSIPEAARKDGEGEKQSPLDSDVKGRKLVLKRDMSQKALAGKPPPVAVKGEKMDGQLADTPVRRSFFRTWVRVVKVKRARAAKPDKGAVEVKTRASRPLAKDDAQQKRRKKPIKKSRDTDPGALSTVETKTDK